MTPEQVRKAEEPRKPVSREEKEAICLLVARIAEALDALTEAAKGREG